MREIIDAFFLSSEGLLSCEYYGQHIVVQKQIYYNSAGSTKDSVQITRMRINKNNNYATSGIINIRSNIYNIITSAVFDCCTSRIEILQFTNLLVYIQQYQPSIGESPYYRCNPQSTVVTILLRSFVPVQSTYVLSPQLSSSNIRLIYHRTSRSLFLCLTNQPRSPRPELYCYRAIIPVQCSSSAVVCDMWYVGLPFRTLGSYLS